MATILNASPSNGLVQTADGSGVLKVQSNGVTTNALAWVNWNGASGASPVIQASYNVSSVTRTGTGLYTIAFSTAMADANYVVTGTAQRPASNNAAHVSPQYNNNPTTTNLYVATYEDSAANIDVNRGYVAIFGN